MNKKQLNLVYAIKENVLVHISQVESGLTCNCICPACNARLIARKGDKVIHHFAHYQSDVCQHGYETSLHMAAKEIIASARKLWIPTVYLNFNSSKPKELIKDAVEINVDEVKLEKTLDDIIPDIIVSSGGKSLIIEIYVTHKIDEQKLNKIKRMNVSTIEIDLSKKGTLITESELKEIILGQVVEKTWVYNALEEWWKSRFIKASEKRDKVMRGFALHIDNCPIKARSWHGKPYANFIDDCIGCKFLIDHDIILCSGYNGIATISDFNLSSEERVKKYQLEK